MSVINRFAEDGIAPELIRPACECTLLRAWTDRIFVDDERIRMTLAENRDALVSPHPYDLEAVTPIIKYDMQQFKLVEEIGALGGLDSRPDLLALSP